MIDIIGNSITCIMRSMSVKNDLQNDLKDAIRSGDDVKKRALRMALAEIRLTEVDKGDDLDDQETYAVLQKEVKAHKESVADAQRADRPDLISENEAEISVLQLYLPKPLSDDELRALAEEVISEVDATSMRQMGQVMKELMPRLGGRATGDQASRIVQELLS